MKRSQSSAVNMKLKKGATDISAMTNKTSFPDYTHHRRYSESALDLKPQEDPEDKKQRLYKTEICRNWEEQNSCRYGDKCQYAHGKEELRFVKRHPRYKTIYCQTFETLGTCPYGIRCTFLHESAPHDPPSSFDSFKSDLPSISPTPASESTSHLSVSDDQVPSSSTSLVATDYPSWTHSRFVPQSTQYLQDDTTSTLANHSGISPLSPLSPLLPLSLLPRPSVSSSSSSSSSSILSASSSAILPPLCQQQQQQGPRRLNFYQDYHPNRLGCVDDYQKQPQHWHQPCFENYLPRHQQEQGPKSQRYQLPGTRSPQDLFADGDGFHSALGVAPPSTVSPPSSFFSRHPPSNLPTCTSSTPGFVNYKYRLIN